MKTNKVLKVLDHGSITLLDTMPQTNLDLAVAQAAWVDPQRTGNVDEVTRVIRYMMRHKHTTPFEQVKFKFHIVLPIFVERQWIRHRMANTNEVSARYKTLPDTYYVPKVVRKKSDTRKQGSSDEELDSDIANTFKSNCDHIPTFHSYNLNLEDGVAPELARINLPVSTYTEKFWTVDLHNLFHFLKLRTAKDAQWEIRQYAQVMNDIVQDLAPISYQAWLDYIYRAVTFSVQEQEALVQLIKKGTFSTDLIKNQTEKNEFREKMEHLLDQKF